MSPPEDLISLWRICLFRPLKARISLCRYTARYPTEAYLDFWMISMFRPPEAKTTLKEVPRVTPSPRNNALKARVQMGMLFAMCVVQNVHDARCPGIDSWASSSIVHPSPLFAKNTCIPELQYTAAFLPSFLPVNRKSAAAKTNRVTAVHHEKPEEKGDDTLLVHFQSSRQGECGS